jgi:hypothetical protein
MECPICEQPIEFEGASFIESATTITLVHPACREEWEANGITAKQNLRKGTFTILHDVPMCSEDAETWEQETWTLTAGTVLTGGYEIQEDGSLYLLPDNFERGEMELDAENVRIDPLEESSEPVNCIPLYRVEGGAN